MSITFRNEWSLTYVKHACGGFLALKATGC